MSDTVTALRVDQLDVEEGFNPREEISAEPLSELVASIATNGIVTALTVRASEEPGSDVFYVVAGHRRLAAARELGLETVPVHVVDGAGALSASVAENLIREDLNPIEEATALQRLAGAEKLGTQKAIAARIGKSASFVADRLRLLKLPSGVQELVATGQLPTSVEKVVRDVAKVSEPAALALCRFAVESGRVEELAEEAGDLLAVLADDESLPADVVLISAARGSVSTADVIRFMEPEAAEALVERYATAMRQIGRGYAVDHGVHSLRVGEEGLDAARAAGCLLEVSTDWSRTSLITDRELVVDLVDRGVAAVEKEAAERLAEEAKAAEARGEEPPPDTAAMSAEERAEAEKAERTKQRKAAERAKLKAEQRNEKLGLELQKRRGAASRKEHSLARAKRIARLVVGQNSELAGAGLRLVMPALQSVEKKTLKSGDERSKVVYKEASECTEWLLAKIEKAKSPQEVLELLAEAMIAAEYADQDAVAMSNRVHWRCSSREVLEEVEAEAKQLGCKGKGASQKSYGF